MNAVIYARYSSDSQREESIRQNVYFREKVITHLAKQALLTQGYRDIHKMIS